MCCRLPKATFYIYFAFFFACYVWIFGIFFYNSWKTGEEKQRKLEKAVERKENEPIAPVSLQSVLATDNLQPALNFSLPLFDLLAEIPDSMQKTLQPCVQLVDPKSLTVCLHDPAKDRGISAHINVYKSWEQELTTSLRDELKRNPSAVFLDIGANLGYYSLLAVSLDHPVIAVEPFEDNLLHFRLAFQLNKFKSAKIKVVSAAVSETLAAKMPFVDSKDNFGARFIISNEFLDFKYRGSPRLFASTVTLDDILPEVENLGGGSNARFIIKMDIQGHECLALRGASKLLSHGGLSTIFLEWEESRKSDDQQCVSEMLQTLLDYRFKPFFLDGRPIPKLDPKDLEAPQDVVWRR